MGRKLKIGRGHGFHSYRFCATRGLVLWKGYDRGAMSWAGEE